MTKGMIWGLLTPAALALLFVGSALGHTGGSTAYAEVTVDGQTVRYTLSLAVDASDKTNPDPLSTERSPLRHRRSSRLRRRSRPRHHPMRSLTSRRSY